LKKSIKNDKFASHIEIDFRVEKIRLENLVNACLDHFLPVRQPLALISQIQRSGGSLLSQLLDGHPEVHAHPYELKFGYPKKYYWPRINLTDSPERWFLLLFEEIVIKHIEAGFKKTKKGEPADQSLPFVFLPSLQKEIFLRYIDSRQDLRLRDICDAYMTSYFNAWLNNQNLHGYPKKWITAFTPRMSMRDENMHSFFQIYPDGKLISIIRDPKNWFPSASRHRETSYGDISKALNLWKKNSRATIRNKEKYQDRVAIIRFEDLIANTEVVMQYLADFLKIKFSKALLVPTFNKSPISANTSFEVEKKKIINSTLYRYKTLTAEELNIIDSLTSDDYESLLRYTVRV
jgi:hypothetical protein